MERKVCFILDAGDWGWWREDRRLSKDQPSMPPQKSGGKSFYRQLVGVGGAMSRNSTVNSDSHLEVVLRWPDQHYPDCFKYSYSSVLGSVCSHILEVQSRNCGSPWEGTKGLWLCLMIEWLLFSLLDCFPLFLHFLTSLIKPIFWPKFFHRQKASRGPGGGTRGQGP